MNNDYNAKRLNPPIWQHDYHVLNKLYKNLSKISAALPKKITVLDYGCGSSPYEHLFEKGKNKYIKIDIGSNKNADIIIRENEKLPLKSDSVNLVLSTQVLEHVNNLNLYLEESNRVLKKNGHLIISTHGIWPFHPAPKDYQRFTAFGLEYALIMTNFRIKKFYSILGPFASITQFTMLVIAERFINGKIIAKLLLAVISVIGNAVIWFEDKVFPAGKNTDSSVFLVWAVKK